MVRAKRKLNQCAALPSRFQLPVAGLTDADADADAIFLMQREVELGNQRFGANTFNALCATAVPGGRAKPSAASCALSSAMKLCSAIGR